ncbi:recombinase family protein [Vibrio sp. SA48]
MNVVLYIRVSSPRQVEEGHSLEGQIEDLRAYCKEKGHVIVNEYIDKGNSAFKGKKRPICERMINEITSGVFEVEGLVVYSLSRFARDLLFQLSAIERLEHSGVRLLSVTETLPEDAMSFKYMTVMMGLVNEMNSEQNAVIVRARLGQAARGDTLLGAEFHSAISLFHANRLMEKRGRSLSFVTKRLRLYGIFLSCV